MGYAHALVASHADVQDWISGEVTNGEVQRGITALCRVPQNGALPVYVVIIAFNRRFRGVAEEYGLSQELKRALLESLAFHHLDTDRPGKDADPLVQAGAHPVGALMAMHVLQHEKRKSRQGVPAELVAG